MQRFPKRRRFWGSKSAGNLPSRPAAVWRWDSACCSGLNFVRNHGIQSSVHSNLCVRFQSNRHAGDEPNVRQSKISVEKQKRLDNMTNEPRAIVWRDSIKRKTIMTKYAVSSLIACATLVTTLYGQTGGGAPPAATSGSCARRTDCRTQGRVCREVSHRHGRRSSGQIFGGGVGEHQGQLQHRHPRELHETTGDPSLRERL